MKEIDMTDISHRFPDGVPETSRDLGERERAELNAYRKMFRAAAKELRIIADALENPLDIEMPSVDMTPLRDLPFSKVSATRILNAMANHGVRTVGEALVISDYELKHIPNFGQGSRNELKRVLAEYRAGPPPK